MTPIFDSNSNLVVWFDGRHLFDSEINQIAFAASSHIFSAKTGNWLGPLHDGSLLGSFHVAN
jgi:hypothetical protein